MDECINYIGRWRHRIHTAQCVAPFCFLFIASFFALRVRNVFALSLQVSMSLSLSLSLTLSCSVFCTKFSRSVVSFRSNLAVERCSIFPFSVSCRGIRIVCGRARRPIRRILAPYLLYSRSQAKQPQCAAVGLEFDNFVCKKKNRKKKNSSEYRKSCFYINKKFLNMAKK